MPSGLSAGINTNRIDVVSLPQEEECVWMAVSWEASESG
jgi:hypothetical protein